MNTVFLEKNENKRIILDYFFNNIKILNQNNIIKYQIPVCRVKTKKINKLSKKIKSNMDREGTNRLVISDELKKIEILKNSLYSENINILNGRYLFKCVIYKIIEYILDLKNERIELCKLTILVNDLSNINKDIIINISKHIKDLKIITNNISRFKKLEKQLFNEYGIIIDVSNNKKTGLLRSNLIVNIDFPEELLNKYRINTNAIIVNINEKIEIQNKKFNGININNYKIQIPQKYKIKGFRDEEIYESIVYNYNLDKIQNKIKEDKIKIFGLIGNNGIIDKKEYKITNLYNR